LWNFLYNAKKLGIPDDVWGEMRNYGAPQPVDATQRLIAEITKLGRIPICSRTNKSERQLYDRFAKAKKNNRFNDAQKMKLEELRTDGPVALSDAARRACNEAALSWARGCNKYSTGDREPKHRRIYHKDGTDVDVFGTVWQKSETSCFVTHPEDFDLDQWEASSSISKYFDGLRLCKDAVTRYIDQQRIELPYLASRASRCGAAQPPHPSSLVYDFHCFVSKMRFNINIEARRARLASTTPGGGATQPAYPSSKDLRPEDWIRADPCSLCHMSQRSHSLPPLCHMQMAINELSACKHVNNLEILHAEISDLNVTQRLQEACEGRLNDILLASCILCPAVETFLMSCSASLLHLGLFRCTGVPGAAYSQILLQCRLLRTYELRGGEENGISANVLAPLFVTKHLTLETLIMSDCPAITDRTLECIQFGLKGTLKYLDLSGAPMVTEARVLSLCSELSQLTELLLDDDNRLAEGCIDKLTELFQMPRWSAYWTESPWPPRTDFYFKRGLPKGWVRCWGGFHEQQ
jgi:hypothetical protein